MSLRLEWPQVRIRDPPASAKVVPAAALQRWPPIPGRPYEQSSACTACIMVS